MHLPVPRASLLTFQHIMPRHWQIHYVTRARPWFALRHHWGYARYGLKLQRATQIGRHDATREPHRHRYGHSLERQEVTQAACQSTPAALPVHRQTLAARPHTMAANHTWAG